MQNNNNINSFATVTASYWAFMLTDGALRMLVLLHFHELGVSAIQLAYIFLIYEFMGIITNFSGGFLAKRFGLASTLYLGLILQILALTLLALLPTNLSLFSMLSYAIFTQAISGIAKDLTKTSAKACVKILSPKNKDDQLFKWIAKLTGSKNAIKGFGFFLGCALISNVGFSAGLVILGGLLLIVLLLLVMFLPLNLPAGTKSVKINDVISSDRRVKLLALARSLLFGARDTWFVVGIPLFFIEILSNGSNVDNKYAFFFIGSFMAVWTIFYGLVQAWAPSFFKNISEKNLVQYSVYWLFVLILSTVLLAITSLIVSSASSPTSIYVIVIGLFVFGGIFAVNSSLHSFLILYFTSPERAPLDVGFYYMSNAAGRLVGTFLSGASYQLGGFTLCLFLSAFLLIFSFFPTVLLNKNN